MIYPNPQIYPHLRTIFIHIPKSAGTAIERALRASPHHIVGGHTTAIGFSMKYQPQFSEYFKFSIVRHPIDRFISAFFYLLQHPIHPALGNDVVHRAATLEAFVDLVLHTPRILSKIVHFLPQAYFVCNTDGTILVDEIYRFEGLEHAWRNICQRIGKTWEPLPSVNSSRHRPWQTYFSSQLDDVMKSTYEKDFALFGYAADPQ